MNASLSLSLGTVKWNRYGFIIGGLGIGGGFFVLALWGPLGVLLIGMILLILAWTTLPPIVGVAVISFRRSARFRAMVALMLGIGWNVALPIASIVFIPARVRGETPSILGLAAYGALIVAPLAWWLTSGPPQPLSRGSVLRVLVAVAAIIASVALVIFLTAINPAPAA